MLYIPTGNRWYSPERPNLLAPLAHQMGRDFRSFSEIGSCSPMVKGDVMSGLANKVALVTGGSPGIGTAVTKRLAANGANVAITYAKDAKSAVHGRQSPH